MNVRSASFAFRVVRRKSGTAAIIYRRLLKANGTERLTRVAALGPLAYSAGASLLRNAVQVSSQTKMGKLEPGPFYPLDPDGGARVACYALVARGLRNAGKLHHAAENLKRADGTEAAWWFGLMNGAKGRRAVRALRILLEAVK
jgi:hypothetical protein